MSKLYINHNYTNKDINILSNVVIREYDIEEAGFNIMIKNNLLKESVISKLQTMEKKQRTIFLGKVMKKFPHLSSDLMKGFIQERQLFFEANDLQDEDILSIKKDAIFLINKKANITKFENIKFKLKNRYSTYISFNNIEIYYSCWTDDIHIKGIKDMDNHPLVQQVTLVIKLFENKVDPNIIFLTLKKLRSDYINRRLPLGCYKEMKSNGGYKLGNYSIDKIDSNSLPYIDIQYNYNMFLAPFIGIFI